MQEAIYNSFFNVRFTKQKQIKKTSTPNLHLQKSIFLKVKIRYFIVEK